MLRFFLFFFCFFGRWKAKRKQCLMLSSLIARQLSNGFPGFLVSLKVSAVRRRKFCKKRHDPALPDFNLIHPSSANVTPSCLFCVEFGFAYSEALPFYHFLLLPLVCIQVKRLDISD
uniref:Putative secreted protein n=1 Tax=Anopheles triannulatus TaxID=58253 RepID=A0A2M4B271_9DIPT